MNQLRRLLVVIVVLCFASSLRARSQAVSAAAQANVSSTVEAWPVAPSDSINPSGALVSGNQAVLNAEHGNAANLETLRDSAHARTLRGGTSRLCFEPGIGWQSVAISAPVSLGMLNIRGTPMGSAAGRTATKGSATNGGLKFTFARFPGANKAMQNGCPTRLASTPASGDINDLIIANRVRAIPSVPSTSINSGTSEWLNTKSLPNPAGGAASQRHFLGFGSVPIGNIQLAARSTSSTSADEITALKSRAYLSPIKLRRMMRNAPDLQTRIELRQLHDRLTKRSHIATGIAKKDKAMTRQLTNGPRDTVYSTPELVGHGRGSESTRRRSSQGHP